MSTNALPISETQQSAIEEYFLNLDSEVTIKCLDFMFMAALNDGDSMNGGDYMVVMELKKLITALQPSSSNQTASLKKVN